MPEGFILELHRKNALRNFELNMNRCQCKHKCSFNRFQDFSLRFTALYEPEIIIASSFMLHDLSDTATYEN